MPAEEMTGLELDDGDIDDDELQAEVAAELAAVTEAEAEAEAGELSTLRRELEETRTALDAERGARLAAVARYREALLAADPALPPELISGDDLGSLDATVEAARRAVAQIRERLADESAEVGAHGFPAGAPERHGPSTAGMSSAEKIAYGLERRERA
jgi:hypothetical protein